MPKPTRHLTALIVGPLALAVALYSLTVLTGIVWFTLLAGGAAGLVVASLATRPNVEGLTFCLSGPRRVTVGGALVVQTLHVHNHSQRSSTALDLHQEVRGLAPVRVRVEPVPPGGRASVELSRLAVARGITESCVMRIKAVSGLGMVCTHGGGEYRHRLVVHPHLIDVPLIGQLAGIDDSPDPVPGRGSDVAGVREWRPGDAAGSVHWRSSARRGTLVVRERGVAATRHVVVAVVCSSAADDWEDVVVAAASACRAAQLAGYRLTLLVWAGGSLASPPVHSVVGLLDWWAGLSSASAPTPAMLSRALASVGTAEVHVALSASTPESSVGEISLAGASAGKRLQRLTVPT